MTNSDPVTHQDPLDRMLRLEALAREVDECRRLVPAPDGVWRGLAHSAFARGLHSLESELAAGHHQLIAAIGRARTALAGVTTHA